MKEYLAFTKKEFVENTRNFRLFLVLILFILFGILSPLTAKFTPQMVEMFAPGLTVPEPAALDSWVQFYKNISSLGFSLMLILFASMFSNEYAKGTLVIMLTKGLPRPMVVLAKLTVSAAIMTAAVWISFGITYSYTIYLWPDVSFSHTMSAAFFLWLMGILYLSILTLGCVMFRQAFPGILFLFAVTTGITLLGLLPPLKRFSPMKLTTGNVDLISGTASVSDFIFPSMIAIILSVACILGAIAVFNKKQI